MSRLRSMPRWVWLFLFVLLTLLPIFLSLGDHPLHGRSEGRYASVSRDMAEHAHWLVPHMQGRAHLTKPPLTYWMEAGCILWLGPTELAVRLPAAISGALTLLGVFLLGWRLEGGPRRGVLAAGVLAMMPLFVEVNRLTLTDSALSLFWFITLGAGYLATSDPSATVRRWAVGALWAAVALGMMTKGPIIWIPVGVLALWLGLSSRWRELRRLHLPGGLLISLIPLALWIGLIVRFHPAAVQAWLDELHSSAIGGGDHPKPAWFFIPIFLGGLFPATAMMSLPGLNQPLRSSRAAVRRATPGALWGLAVVVPFVIFSLNPGKLATYLLPLCAPLALSAAATLDGWLTRQNDAGAPTRETPPTPSTRHTACAASHTKSSAEPLCSENHGSAHDHTPGRGRAGSPAKSRGRAGAQALPPDHPPAHHPPDVRITYFICITIAAILGIAATIYQFGITAPGVLAVLGLQPLAASWLWWQWHRGPTRRATGMAAVFVAFVALFCVGHERVEDRLLRPAGLQPLLKQIQRQAGITDPVLVTYGYIDANLPFYRDKTAAVGRLPVLRHWMAAYPHRLIVLADSGDWRDLQQSDPSFTAMFDRLDDWRHWPIGRDAWVLQFKRPHPRPPHGSRPATQRMLAQPHMLPR